ncbi:hypothetical protein QR680_005102 [Steinernema hermaphroditum]|uniref:Uncharacterized protein n=1 Tax=Steinernema hermaphroditum TaxID=289476 RepID=A0AA39LUR5_9BILA|nr:hypothetical protein QR680_005094 [Steinernema hermaphroditum]KAK0410385.1 hypothetical protein QR680_005102 [Steinernema hermaphroditum]
MISPKEAGEAACQSSRYWLALALAGVCGSIAASTLFELWEAPLRVVVERWRPPLLNKTRSGPLAQPLVKMPTEK